MRIADRLIKEEMEQGELFDLGPYTEPDREPPRITTTYSIITPESAEHGDVEEEGWEDEEGVEFIPDEQDTEDGVNVAELAIEWLIQHSVEQASSYPFSPGTWYTSSPYDDYRTGASTEYNFHLEGFTPEEEEEIYDFLKKHNHL